MREADYLYLWTGSFAVYVAALNHFFAQKPYAVYEQPWMDATYLATYLERQGPIVRWLLPRSMRRARERMIRGASHVYVHGGKLREECRAIRGEEVLDVVPLTPVRRTDFYERAPTFPSQVRRIAFVGGVVGRGKGVEVLLDALRDLKSRGVPFEFRSATKVPFTESQTKQLAGLELGDAAQIHVGLKWDPDLRDLLRQSDILVVASWSEGFPRVIYEAGSQGLALVTTPVGGIPYALKDNHDALFVAPGGASALADALERLARQPTLVHQLGRNLQRTVWSLLFEASDFESHGQQVIHWAQSVARQRALDTDRA
jgi:glycosyltransferase involved in cell wall biosynthesis